MKSRLRVCLEMAENERIIHENYHWRSQMSKAQALKQIRIQNILMDKAVKIEEIKEVLPAEGERFRSRKGKSCVHFDV